MSNLLLKSVRPLGAAPRDVLLSEGRIAAVAAQLQADAGCEVEDGGGCLLLPGLVDAHAHLDKTLWGTPWHSHTAGPSVPERIAYEQQVRSWLALSPATQSGRLLRHMLARGTTHVRTHVDIGPDIRLSHLHGVQQMHAAHAQFMDLEIVAFPQTGVMRVAGMLELLDRAMHEGAHVVGGLDPVSIDRDPAGQLNGLFDIAERHTAGIDIHLHDGGESGAVTIEMIAERARAHGMHGKIVISHAFCLGGVSAARRDALIELLVEADIAIMTHAPAGGTPCPPARLLAQRGVRVFTGSDGVRDAWGPLNTGDMLERAFIVSYVNGFRDDAGLELALHMATFAGAQVMQRDDYGLSVGCVADLVLVDASCLAEAVVAHPPRRLVVKRGRVVARDGGCVLDD